MKQHIGQRITARYSELTPHEQRVATFILDHFDDFAVYNAAELARLTGVSKATVSRLFKRLGFDSFRDVKAHARELRNFGMPLVTDGQALDQGGELFKRHFEREQDNLRHALGALDAQTFKAVVERFDAAREVVVVGLRNSYPVALHLRQQLIQARRGVRLAPQPGQSLAEELAGLDADDLIVVVGFRRRASSFEALMKTLKASESKVLLIGDATAARFADSADWRLECPLDSISAFDSYAAAMSLVNLLVNGVLHRRLKAGRARIDTISALYDDLDELTI